MKRASAQAQPAHFSLPPMPYPANALEPHISAETLNLHHGKHHKKYVDTMNQILEKERVSGGSLEDIVRNSTGKLFNNAAQAWNHDFYWHSLSPRSSKPSAMLMRRIEKDFGSYDKLAKQLAEAASNHFGSGWAWLVKKQSGLAIVTTANADTPMARGDACLLTIDVWEHAYYVDYRNEREKYLKAVIGELLNWEFAEKNIAA
jgi:Fe-Mn family superoxide dismutase